MPLVINTSPNIASLDSEIIASLCEGKIFVGVGNSIFIGAGALNVLGASVKVVSPTGVTIKNYPTSGYDIYADSPPFSTFDEVTLPTQAGNYQYGSYVVTVKMTDADGTEYTLEKTVKICEPDSTHKTRKYGSLSATLKGVCKDGKLFVTADTPPNYRGKMVESQVNVLKLEYPTSSLVAPLEDIAISSFSEQLYEGVWKLTGTICATYDMGDSISVEVLYKVKKEKNVKCALDECCVSAGLQQLKDKMDEACTEKEQNEYAALSGKAILLLKIIQVTSECGEDASDYITDLEDILGCQCTCNCAEGTPIINTSPAKDFIFEGCGFTKTTVGLTDTIEFNNYTYVLSPNENGGAFTVGAIEIEGCIATIPLTFNITAVYNQIKSAAGIDATSWAAIINPVLDSINQGCLGYTTEQWMAMTFLQRIQALADAACEGHCSGEISDDVVTDNGNDAVFEWVETGEFYEVAIYVDDILVGTVLKGAGEFTAVGKADGNPHTYALVSKCSNGAVGNALDGSFNFYGCPTIAPPTVTLSSVADDCPYDLTSLVEALPSGIEAEWHDANNTGNGSLVVDPTQATSGTFYVFAKNSDNCYSLGTKVILVCSEATNCSAPQNLIVEAISGGYRVRFISAAYAPPSNSYTVKRKLGSDPDVDGSYTTIGTPTYNSTVNRWEILDASVTDNTLYTYKAISNCVSTSPSITYNFANLSCPSLTLTPDVESMDYSFVPVGGGVDKYVVEIWDNSGLTRISYDTHIPAFSNPTEGTFMYLDAGTSYKVRVVVYIGTYFTVCSFTNSSTTGPTLTQISNTDTGPGGIRTQIAQVGANVSAGDVYSATVYSHTASYTAILGDTPTTVAIGLRDVINATSELDWDSASSAPASGTTGFPPVASASGANLTIVLNYQNAFAFGTI